MYQLYEEFYEKWECPTNSELVYSKDYDLLVYAAKMLGQTFLNENSDTHTITHERNDGDYFVINIGTKNNYEGVTYEVFKIDVK